jgi:hypothetical protein
MVAGFAALDYITLIGFASSRSRIVLRGECNERSFCLLRVLQRRAANWQPLPVAARIA